MKKSTVMTVLAAALCAAGFSVEAVPATGLNGFRRLWYAVFVRTFISILLLAALTGSAQEVKVDLSKTVTDTNAPPANLPAAITRANAAHRMVLLEFGSSDSCPPCVAFQQSVASTPEFQAYAASHLVFVRLDFPLKAELRPDTKATNILLLDQFQVDAYPTFIALNRDGKEFWRQTGLAGAQFNPAGFISLVKSVQAHEK
ncbi:MAG TPA: thioredoxin family protein [Verrucomicrobiae bacterium]|nr:thioredoxin family protein [Verrucomicrobiae bacterium]